MRLLELGGRRLPFLRWSVLRMVLGMKTLTKEWQVGDGRKQRLADYVLEHAPAGDLDELGTYCGDSGLRAARAMKPGARLVSIEFNAANAAIARHIWDHAGIGDELTVVLGTLGDGGATVGRLRDEHGFTAGALDFVFLDHVEYQSLIPDVVLESEYLGAP